MKTTKIYIGAEVNNKKNQHGVITRIITKSTGYVEVKYDNGTTRKEMAFNLTDNEGNALKATPKKREASEPTEAEKIQSRKNWILEVNEKELHVESVRLMSDMLNRMSGNDFFDSLRDAWWNAMYYSRHFSEKQAYWLAKMMIEAENK